MQRSAIFLSPYHYTIEYKINVNVVNPMDANADFLSRLILPIHENKTYLQYFKFPMLNYQGWIQDRAFGANAPPSFSVLLFLVGIMEIK